MTTLNQELILSQIRQGYLTLETEPEKTIPIFHKVLKDLRNFMAAKKIDSFEAFDDLYLKDIFISNWIYDYQETIYNYNHYKFRNPDSPLYKDKEAFLYDAMIELSRPGSDLYLNGSRALADFYYFEDKPQQGEKIYIELFEAYPKFSYGWIGYARQYLDQDRTYFDPKKAFNILSHAMTVDQQEDLDIICQEVYQAAVILNDNLDIYYKDTSVPEGTPVENLLEILQTPCDDLYVQEIIYLSNHPNQAKAPLIQKLKDILEDPKNDIYSQSGIAIVILYLLGEMKAQEAFEDILKLVTLPEDQTGPLLGDLTTRDLDFILYETFNGNIDLLKAVIVKPDICPFVRGKVILILAYHWVMELKDIPSLLSYFEGLLESDLLDQEDVYWGHGIASAIMALKLEDALYVVETLYHKDLIDPNMFGSFEDYQASFNHSDPVTYHEDLHALERLATWFDFNNTLPKIIDLELLNTYLNQYQGKTRQTPPSKQQAVSTKVGRNDPCPCGSGKKYKKCCLI